MSWADPLGGYLWLVSFDPDWRFMWMGDTSNDPAAHIRQSARSIEVSITNGTRSAYVDGGEVLWSHDGGAE